MPSSDVDTKNRPDVALIVETSVVYGREILKGISRFISTHARWSVSLDERELEAPPPDWLLDWNGDGVICRSTTPALADALQAKGISLVDLNDRHGYLGAPRVASDMRAIGRLAAEYLLHRGYTNIAYCGFEAETWCEQRLAGVTECVVPCGVYRTPWSGLREHAWHEERAQVCEWLAELPLPVAVVAANDVRGYHVLDACRTMGLAVPEEVAVLGVDNAETFCGLCDPPLSSVIPDAERIGYEAAATLEKLMARGTAGQENLLIPPTGVASRASTDSVAIHDPLVAKAAQWIRETEDRNRSVEALVRFSGVSRSTLERRFRTALGSSPQNEIRRARLKRVKSLLQRTDWSLSRIAEEAGYEHPEYMMVQFKRETGQTPGSYRLDKKTQLADPISH